MANSREAILAGLLRRFEPSDLEWRAIYTRAPQPDRGNPNPLVLIAPYVNRPSLVNRLNQVCGIDGWQTDTRVSGGHVYMGLGIRFPSPWHGPVQDQLAQAVAPRPPSSYEWVWRWDGTGFLDSSDKFSASDAGKGDFSNAFKRCCEMFGIALYLRELKAMKAILDPEGRYSSDIRGYKRQRWNPPGIQGTPSYPGVIPGWDATEGGEPDRPGNGNGEESDPTEGLPDEKPDPNKIDEEKAAQRLEELKSKVRGFMKRNGLYFYHLDAVVQRHPKLKARYAGAHEIIESGDMTDWTELEYLTRRNKSRWEEAPKELADEFPTGDERVKLLRELMKECRPSGPESVAINTAIATGWNDAVEHWIDELLSRRDGDDG